MKSKNLILLLLFFLKGSSLKAQDTTSFHYWENKILSTENFNSIRKSLSNDEFEILNDKKLIPKSLMKLLGENKKRVKFSNPDEDYRSTDIVFNKNQPSRQIMMLAKSGSHLLLTYKHGGFGLHHHILWCELEKDKVKDLWIGVTFKDLFTVEDVIMATDIDIKRLNTNKVCK